MVLRDSLTRAPNGGEADLVKALDQVRDAACRIWQVQRLLYFTDHRAQTHSERIIRLLGDLLTDLQDSPHALNAHELFILMSAVYLHDIGMQDFAIIERGVEEFTTTDYDQIRKEHADRSCALILTRSITTGRDTFAIPLDDDVHVAYIALVSRGHASQNFDEVVSELQKMESMPGGQPCRGSLLCALLLLGDELDLHRDRARFPKEMHLSPVSTLHFFAHHYITGLRIERVQGRRYRFELIFEFPPAAARYQEDIIKWVTRKLVRQIRRVKPIIERETGGEVVLDERVSVRSSTTVAPFRELPEEAGILLGRDLVRSVAVDREEIYQLLGRFVTDYHSPPHALVLVSDAESDDALLLRRLEAEALSNQAKITSVSFSVAAGHDVDGFLDGISALCGMDIGSELFGEGAPSALDTGLGESPAIVTLRELQGADEPTRTWICSEFLPTVSRGRLPLRVVAFMEADDPCLSIAGDSAPVYRLEAFTEGDLVAYYEQLRGFHPDEAWRNAASTYAKTGGNPYRVMLGIDVELQQEIIRVAT